MPSTKDDENEPVVDVHHDPTSLRQRRPSHQQEISGSQTKRPYSLSLIGRNLESLTLNIKHLVCIGIAIFIVTIAGVFAVSFAAIYLAKDTSTTSEGFLVLKNTDEVVRTHGAGSQFQFSLDPKGFLDSSPKNTRDLQRNSGCRRKLADTTRAEVEARWADMKNGIKVSGELRAPSSDESWIVVGDPSTAQRSNSKNGAIVINEGRLQGYPDARIQIRCLPKKDNCEIFETNCFFANNPQLAIAVDTNVRKKRRLNVNDMKIPDHIAFIPDGNRRWAKTRGKPSSFGHVEGINRVYEMTKDVFDLGIKYMTVYSFSTENIQKRDKDEIDFLFDRFSENLEKYQPQAMQERIVIQIVGDLFDAKVPESFRELAHRIQSETMDNAGPYKEKILTLLVNYGGRHDIVDAGKRLAMAIKDNELSPDDVTEDIFRSFMLATELPDPDLVVRTGDTFRTSNFMLWNTAYSEWFFTPRKWPECDKSCLLEALDHYSHSERRFGGNDPDDTTESRLDVVIDTSGGTGVECYPTPVGSITHKTFEGNYSECDLAFFGHSIDESEKSYSELIRGGEAICVFVATMLTSHLPHGMEQLYRCFSFFLANPKLDSVMVFEKASNGIDSNNIRTHGTPFYDGFLEVLKDIFQVSIQEVEQHEIDGKVSYRLNNPPNVKLSEIAQGFKDGFLDYVFTLDIGHPSFAMCGVDHARKLSNEVFDYYGMKHITHAASVRKQNRVPSVGILNREESSKRSLLNADKITRELQVASNNGTIFTIHPVEFFEGKSFLHQAEFFHSVDIIISPHGAQLTGMPFMPSCGSVMEIFLENFCLEEYFGSLAAASGLSHTQVYLSEHGECQLSTDPGKIRHANDPGVCAAVEPVVEEAINLVHKWKDCVQSDGEMTGF